MMERLESLFGWIVRSPISYAVILIFGLALYLPGFTKLSAVDRDEARFAQASRQMLESHDFIDIRNGETARLKKPVGIYWLQAAATKLAGGEDPANPIWTYRLPSLIGALGAILMTLAIGRRWFGTAPGFAAAALLAACPVLGYEARQADTDAILLLTILVALANLAAAWIPTPEGPLPRRRWIGFWVAIGVGILIKGPVILLVVGLAAIMLAIFDRRLDGLKRLRPWPGIAIAAVIALPWLIAITISTKGAFFSESVGTDLMTKLSGGQESHGAPPGSYLLEFPLGFWPGSLFALLALPWVWRNRRDHAVLFCLAWIIPAWIVFEAIPTKLPRYVLPLYPGIALLAGTALTDRLLPTAAATSRLWFPRAVIVLWSLIGLALGGTAIALAPLADGRLSIRGILAGLALWAVTVAGARAIWRGKAIRAASVSLAGMIVAWGVVFGAALPALDAPWIAPHLKEALFEKLPTGHGPVLIAGYAEPSAMIALGTATRFGSGPDAAKLLADNADGVAIVSSDQQADFTTTTTGSGTAVTAIGTVSGFNYAKGKRVTLTLYRRTPQ